MYKNKISQLNWIEQLPTKQKVEGSIPSEVSSFFRKENWLIVVMVTYSTVSRVLRVRFSYEPQMVFLAYLVKYQTVNLKNRVRSPKTPKMLRSSNGQDDYLSSSKYEFDSRTEYKISGKITIGCLPALDAGGCRFEPCFSDKKRKYAEVGESGRSVKPLSYD